MTKTLLHKSDADTSIIVVHAGGDFGGDFALVDHHVGSRGYSQSIVCDEARAIRIAEAARLAWMCGDTSLDYDLVGLMDSDDMIGGA